MAKNRNRQNTDQTDEVLVDLVEAKDQGNGGIEGNQKLIFGVLFGIAALVALVFIYQSVYKKPLKLKAAASMSQAQMQFEQDSFALALTNPGGGFLGFLDIIDQYGSTPAGNTSKYYAGVSYLHLGDYNKSIEYLKDFSAVGSVMPAMKNGALGDAYSELQDFEKAINFYESAANSSDNEFVAAEYFKKLGMLHENQKDYKSALAAFNTIKEKYPSSVAGRDVEKLIARVASLAN